MAHDLEFRGEDWDLIVLSLRESANCLHASANNILLAQEAEAMRERANRMALIANNIRTIKGVLVQERKF